MVAFPFSAHKFTYITFFKNNLLMSIAVVEASSILLVMKKNSSTDV